jgi:Cu(I)/Ag(I) efflux system membrane fusion protein
MSGAAPPKSPEPVVTHRAQGRIERIDGSTLTVSHGPVPSLKWGAMTMEFAAPKSGVPVGVAVGDAVSFEFVQTPAGDFAVTRLERVAGAKP